MNRRQTAANRARMENMRNTSTDFDNDVVKRIKQGLCQSCGKRTHKIMLGGLKKVPLDNDKVLKGRCLDCHPLRMSTIDQRNARTHQTTTTPATARPQRQSTNTPAAAAATHHEYSNSNSTAAAATNRRDDYSQSSEVSDLTLQTFRSNAVHARRSDRTSTAAAAAAAATVDAAATNTVNHPHHHPPAVNEMQQSTKSFSRDSYWNTNDSSHSSSRGGGGGKQQQQQHNNTSNPMKLMEDLDELPGGSTQNHLQQQQPQQPKKLLKTFKRLSIAGSSAGAAAGIVQDDVSNEPPITLALPLPAAAAATKVRIEEPLTSASGPSKPLPLFGSKSSSNRRNHRSSIAHTNAAGDGDGGVGAGYSSAAGRRASTSASSEPPPTAAAAAAAVEYRAVPESVVDRKIKIEEPVAQGHKQKPLPLFGSSGRRNHRSSSVAAAGITPAPAALQPSSSSSSPPPAAVGREYDAPTRSTLRESVTEPDSLAPPQSYGTANTHTHTHTNTSTNTNRPMKKPITNRERAELRRLRSREQGGVIKVPTGARASLPGVVREPAPSSSSNDRVARKMQGDAASSRGGASSTNHPHRNHRASAASAADAEDGSTPPAHITPIINQMKLLTSVPELLDIMASNAQVARIQEVGCMKFRNLSSHPSFISGIRDAGGIGCIIRAMDQHSSSGGGIGIGVKGVQEQGCAALWCLAVNGDENKDAIQLEGGVTSIVHAMREFGGDVRLLTWAIGALCSLSYHPTCKVVIGSSGGILEIVRAMQTHENGNGSSRAVQELGLKSLWSLSRESQSNVESICYHGGIAAIVAAISNHAACDIIQGWGCRLLCVMGSFYGDLNDNNALQSIVDVGGLAAVVSIMADRMGDGDVVRAAMAFLARTARMPGCCGPIASAGGIDAVSGAILAHCQTRHGDAIRDQGCSILANLALHPSNRRMFADTRAVEALTNVLSCRSNGIHVYMDSCSVLLHLVLMDDDFLKGLILSAGGVDVLTGLLRRPLSRAAQDLMCAILAAIVETNGAILSFLSADGVRTIGTILEDRYEEEPVQASACLLFRNVASNGQGRSEMAEKMVIHAIVNSMRSHPRSDCVQENACCALWNLSVDEECAAAISEAEGVAELLSATGHSSEMVVEAACGALMNLTACSDDVRRELGLIDGLDVVLNVITNFRNNIGILVKAIGILVNLCTDSKVAGDIERTDGISKLIQASNAHAYVAEVQEIYCVAIRNLCSKSFPNQRAVLNGGGIDTVVNAILNNKTESVQEEGCACLRTLAGSASDEIKSHIVKAGGIDAIMDVMDEHPTNESIQAEACATIPLLSGAADFQIVLVPRGASTGY